MKFADKSTVARLEGDREQYLHYTRLALEKEAAAADLMVVKNIEPTRSVLHRSAATLAWRCEEYDMAKRLIYRALAGDPPPEIEFELNDLLGSVKLALSNINLSDKHLRLTLDGNDIAFGRAPARTLANRIIGLEEILEITAKAPIPLYYDSVGAASFYVDLMVSNETQPSLPGFDSFEEVVEPLIQHLDLLNRGEIETLERTIANPKKYADFVNAAIKLAPDGVAISSVHLQALVAGRIQSISFERNQDDLSEIPMPEISIELEESLPTEENVKKIGILQGADGSADSDFESKTECELKTETEGTWVIEVHDDIIHEVLGSYWKRKVEIEGKQMRRVRSLRRILVENVANIREVPPSPKQIAFVR